MDEPQAFLQNPGNRVIIPRNIKKRDASCQEKRVFLEKTRSKDMISDPRHLRLNKNWFRKWLDQHSDSEDDDYKTHAADVLEKWLEKKMPRLRIGNLFRFATLKEYNPFKESIISSPSYEHVNDNDMNGRPNAALNHYSNYLASFSEGELNAKLNAAIPTGGRRVISGNFKKR